MTKEFKVEGIVLWVDKEETERLYVTEIKITDNCDCSDCSFYANSLIKQPFGIFQMLQEMGVDLSKNLSSESTGVWCVRDDREQLIHFDQVYRVYGTILDRGEINYLRVENNYKVEAKFIPYKSDYVDIELKFDRDEDEKV